MNIPRERCGSLAGLRGSTGLLGRFPSCIIQPDEKTLAGDAVAESFSTLQTLEELGLKDVDTEGAGQLSFQPDGPTTWPATALQQLSGPSASSALNAVEPGNLACVTAADHRPAGHSASATAAAAPAAAGVQGHPARQRIQTEATASLAQAPPPANNINCSGTVSKRASGAAQQGLATLPAKRARSCTLRVECEGATPQVLSRTPTAPAAPAADTAAVLQLSSASGSACTSHALLQTSSSHSMSAATSSSASMGTAAAGGSGAGATAGAARACHAAKQRPECCPACGLAPMSADVRQHASKTGRPPPNNQDDPRNRKPRLTRDFIQRHIQLHHMSVRDIGYYHGHHFSSVSRAAKKFGVQPAGIM